MDYLFQVDILEKIVPYLDIKDVYNLMSSCKELSELIRNFHEIWIILGIRILLSPSANLEIQIQKKKNRLRYLNSKELFKLFSNLRIGKRYFLPKVHWSDFYHMHILECWLNGDYSTVWSLYDIVTYPEDIEALFMLNCYFMNTSNIKYFETLSSDISIIKRSLSSDLFGDGYTNKILKHIYLSDNNGGIYITNCRIKTHPNLIFYPIEINTNDDHKYLKYYDFYYSFTFNQIGNIEYYMIDKDSKEFNEKEITDFQEFIELTKTISLRLNVNHRILNNLIIVSLTRGHIRLLDDNYDLIID